MKLSNNIERIQLYDGKFEDLGRECRQNNIIFKEHPTSAHYKELEKQGTGFSLRLRCIFNLFLSIGRKPKSFVAAKRYFDNEILFPALVIARILTFRNFGLMKHFTRTDLDNLQRRKRANLINSITGYKPANLIGTVSKNGISNLAIFSSCGHLGANPPLIGFIQRPVGEVSRHTYENIKATSSYTINHIHESFVEKAHFTSAKFPSIDSEFDKCGLTEETFDGFKAPFVKESKIKIGLKFVEEMFIKRNGTILVIGEIEHVILPEEAITENGNANLDLVEDVCISGLDTYHQVNEMSSFPYAKPAELPDFE